MKLTIIGNYGPYPKCGYATSCYLVETENTRIIMDFGAGALSIADNYCDIDSVDAIVLSHTHYDHSCDLLPLAYRIKTPNIFKKYGKKKLYMPPRQENGLAGEIIRSNAYDVYTYCEGEKISVGDISLSFCEMIHPVSSFAIKAECEGKVLVYSGDTVYTEKLEDFCKGADLILADALQAEGVKNPHMTVLDAHNLQQSVNCTVICTHEPPSGCGDCEKYPGLIKAEKGYTFEI